MTARIPLLAAVLAVIAGLGWAAYYGWATVAEMQERIAAIEERESGVSASIADLEGQIAALALDMTDQSLAVTVQGLDAHVANLQAELEALRSVTDEQAGRIGEMGAQVDDHEMTLGDITGPFWSPLQDRNLDALNDSLLQVESYIGEIDGQLTDIEAYLVEVDDGLQAIERCLSSFSEFIPGC